MTLVASFLTAPPEKQMLLIRDLLGLGTTDALGGVLHLSRNLPPGELKSQICQELLRADLSGHRDFLLDSWREIDPDSRRALAQSLGSSADSAFVLKLVDCFESSTDSFTKTSAMQMLRAVTSKEAILGLTGLLADPQKPLSEPLINVATQVVAQQATAPVVNVLTARLDRTTDAKAFAELAEIVAGIRTPSARSALLYAARGNRDATRPATRLTAIRALANYPAAETVETLQQLQNDADPEIRKTAAATTAKILPILGH
ncbi:MAG: HEAT repeat [Verrucomicrobia bacterium]|nr:MAG: HEAT repeat [Verrucomicrobiota bacterium]